MKYCLLGIYVLMTLTVEVLKQSSNKYCLFRYCCANDGNSQGIETTLKCNIVYLGIDVLLTVTVQVLKLPCKICIIKVYLLK